MQELRQFFEALAVPIALSVFGGIARCCRFGVTSWRQFVASSVVSGFTGVVVHLLIQETALSSSIQAAIVASSGYGGGAILDALSARIVKGVENLPGPAGTWNGVERRDRPGADTKPSTPPE